MMLTLPAVHLLKRPTNPESVTARTVVKPPGNLPAIMVHASILTGYVMAKTTVTVRRMNFIMPAQES